MPNELPVQPDQPAPPPVPPVAPAAPPISFEVMSPVSASTPVAPKFSKKRLALALAIAAISDAISAFATLVPPVQWVVDVVTAVLLFIVLGWNWLLLPGLIMEAIPGLGVVPFWVLVVAAIGAWGTIRPKSGP